MLSRLPALDWIWKFVDILYYPVAAAAIILTVLNFQGSFAEEHEREADAAKNELNAEFKRRANSITESSKISLKDSRDWMDFVSYSSHRCTDFIVSKHCSAAAPFAEAIEKYEKNFSKESTLAVGIREVCQSFPYLLRDLSTKGGFASGLSISLRRELFGNQGEKRPTFTTFANLALFADTWEKSEKERWYKIIYDSQSDTQIKGVFDDSLFFSKTILFAHSFCFSQHNNFFQNLSRLENEVTIRESEVVEDFDKSLTIEKRRAKFASIMEWLKNSAWSFVIIVGLALKFGRGCVALRKR